MRLRVASTLILALTLASPAAAVEVRFLARVDVESGAPARRPIPADLDRDGDLDLVAFHTGSSPQVVWYENTAGDGFRGTAPVGSYAANGYGLFDMSGNRTRAKHVGSCPIDGGLCVTWAIECYGALRPRCRGIGCSRFLHARRSTAHECCER